MFLSGVSRGELLQLDLVINVTGLVEQNEQRSNWEEVQLQLTSSCPLELLAAEYLHETNISTFVSQLFTFCSLAALKKSLKKKETRLKKEIVEVLQQGSCRRKRLE